MKNEYQIRSLADLTFVADRVPRILTLFSGGVDSSYVLMELAKQRKCEVIALTVDLGDGVDHDDLRAIASHFGARSLVIDGREMFAREAVLPALWCNGQYMGLYPISASLSRPIISKFAIDLAEEYECGAIVHTANQSQNSLRRLNGAICQLGFDGFYGSPYEYSALTREEKIEALRNVGLHKFQARGTSGDANLWSREFESGLLDNPESFTAPEDLFVWTAKSSKACQGDSISLTFRAGVPCAIDGRELPLVELIAQLNERVGSYGIGRYAGLEHLDQGEKVLEVREAPAAHLLMNAFRHLEMASFEPELLREKLAMEQIWVREAVEGRWYGSLRASVEAFVNVCARKVTGSVQYKLRVGAADVCSIRAAEPRYLTDRDGWEKKVAKIRSARTLSDLHTSSLSKPVPGKNSQAPNIDLEMAGAE